MRAAFLPLLLAVAAYARHYARLWAGPWPLIPPCYVNTISSYETLSTRYRSMAATGSRITDQVRSAYLRLGADKAQEVIDTVRCTR